MEDRTEELEKRLIDLEIKFTHQDDLIDQLNKIVTKHEFTIDRLVNDVKELKLALNNGPGEVTNEKPPHY